MMLGIGAPTWIYASLSLVELGFIARAILYPHRDPAARVAWVVVIGALPLLGIVAYTLFGETNIGRRRVARSSEVLRSLPTPRSGASGEETAHRSAVPEQYRRLFTLAKSISGCEPVGGNAASLFAVSDEMIESLVGDIDGAKEHVHLLFYIWLADKNGLKVVEALKRAAARGVQCRAMADGLGSRALLKSPHWKSMQDAGVRLGVALPLGNPLLRPFQGRMDLRNHRKIVVIDNRITYCGSQNCADAEFRVKPKYAPWVDVVMRFEGPVALQNQRLFAGDWMISVDEDLKGILSTGEDMPSEGFTAQVFGTGPTIRHSAMPEMFESLMFAAQRRIVITTPYYVPDEAMQNALCAAAHRGVDVTVVFPARNDSFIVAAASRSYYADLLASGVKIFEYVGGLLHAKTFTIDGEVTLIGSANMDRRSFDLNYENNILLHDHEVTAGLRAIQEQFISRSREIVSDEVAAWPLHRRLWNNAIGMLGPLL